MAGRMVPSRKQPLLSSLPCSICFPRLSADYALGGRQPSFLLPCRRGLIWVSLRLSPRLVSVPFTSPRKRMPREPPVLWSCSPCLVRSAGFPVQGFKARSLQERELSKESYAISCVGFPMTHSIVPETIQQKARKVRPYAKVEDRSCQSAGPGTCRPGGQCAVVRSEGSDRKPGFY